MAVDFSKSRTKENLMRAFAGESQARNRYTLVAKKAGELGMYALKDIFLYTAEQERAHAERYYQLLKSESGQTIVIDGGYPVDWQETLPELLRAAEHNEREEYETVYQAFGDTAKEEGFFEAASAFYQIAQVEHVHEKRFGRLAGLLETGSLYEREETGRWMCTNCGYIHEGKMVPAQCPVCRYEKGYFLPLELACYLDASLL